MLFWQSPLVKPLHSACSDRAIRHTITFRWLSISDPKQLKRTTAGIIKRNVREQRSRNDNGTIYGSMVRPHLEYGIQTWNPFLKKDVENLERVQRRGTKIIIEGSQRLLSHNERLKHCGLTALE